MGLSGSKFGEASMKSALWKKFFVIFAVVCVIFLLIAVISSLVTCRYTSQELEGAALELLNEEYGVSGEVISINELNGAAVVVCRGDGNLYAVPFKTGMFSGKYSSGDIVTTDGSTSITMPITSDVEYTMSADGTAELNATASSGRYTWQIVIALLVAVYLAYFWSFGTEKRRRFNQDMEESIKGR